MANRVKSFVVGDEGAALAEYGLLVALIAVVCVIVVAVLGNKASAMYSEMNAKFF